jgi:malate permease and related proteins
MNPTITDSLPVISLVVVGFLLKTLKVVKAEDGPLISRLILNVTLPCVIFLSISQAKIEFHNKYIGRFISPTHSPSLRTLRFNIVD